MHPLKVVPNKESVCIYMMIMSQDPAAEDDGRRRLCDFCGETTAVLFCRADSAKLCLACDRQVHSTKPLFTKHARSLLCDACDSTPASIFCCAHSSVLCHNCDWEAHTAPHLPPAVHDRRPLEGFTGCPSVAELLALLGFDDHEAFKKPPLLSTDDPSAPARDNNNNDDGENICGFSDFLVWETPSVVSLDDLIMPRVDDDSSSGHAFQAMGVPPLPKNRNATCGRHKEEILFQIREMSKLEPNLHDGQADVEPLIQFSSPVTKEILPLGKKDESIDQNDRPNLVPSYEANSFEWHGDEVDVANQEDFSNTFAFDCCIEMNILVPDKDSEVGDSSGPSGRIIDSHGDHVHSPVTGSSQILPRVSFRELNTLERETAISRYKEKKKTRRYDKRIRYETRKARAESMTRIRGRFAKMESRKPEPSF